MLQVSFAQGFSVAYHDTYKASVDVCKHGELPCMSSLSSSATQVVTNSLVNETYVLYQCGLAAPSNALLPPGAKVFSIPLSSVSVADTIPLGYMVRMQRAELLLA